MAYGVKYILQVESLKYKNTYRVDISEDGYVGQPSYKKIGAGHLRLIKKEGVIQYTSLYLSIQADSNFEYLQFFQYNNRKFKVQLYENNTCIWSGFIVAESYSEPYKNPPYDVDIIATDGLGLLKNYTFENNGFQTYMESIVYCLGKLGLSLGYSISVDLFEDSMNTAAAMFDQLYYYGDIFNGENCSDVLESLLPFGASITQKENKWLIRRTFEDAEKTHLVYNADGTYTGTESGETVLAMGDLLSQGVWPRGMPTLNMEHAWKDAVIVKEYGKGKSFLKNFDFSGGVYAEDGETIINPRRGTIMPSGNNVLDYWENPNNIDVAVLDADGQRCLKIVGYEDEGIEKYISQTVNSIKNTVTNGGNFIFSCKYDVLGGYYSSTLGTVYPIEVTIKLRIKLAGTQIYYLTTEGWTTTDSFIEVAAESTGGEIIWTDLKIITNNIPIDGDITVELYKIEYISGSPRNRSGSIAGVLFTDVRLYNSDIDLYIDPEEIPVDILPDAAESGETITLKPVDLPQFNNSKLLFNNGNYTAAGVLSTLWINNGGDTLPIEEIITNQLLNYYGKPRQKISGCEWRGSGLHLNAIVQHNANYGRKFAINRGEWNIIEDTLNVEFIEIPNTVTSIPPDQELPWILDDGIWGDEGEIWKDGEDSVWEDENTENIEIFIYGYGLHDITIRSSIQPGDIIQTFTGYYDGKLFENSTEINHYPFLFDHLLRDAAFGYKVSEVATESYSAWIGLVRDGRTITIKVNIVLP